MGVVRIMKRIILLLISLLLLHLTGFDNFTVPEYWNCCGFQRVPGSDPLAGLYRLWYGVPPPLLPQCRDFCVYSKMGETDGTLYCFTYQDAIHHPVCEDPIPDSSTQSFSTSDDGFVPPFLDP